MKKLSSAKGAYLLEAPLEVLHSESLEWLEEIEFGKDEVAFFFTLIIRKTKVNPLLFKTKNAKEIERHLVYVSAEKLDDLRMELDAHEKFLSPMMKSVRMDENLYRFRHRIISRKIHAMENEFKKMKNKIFKLALKKK